MKENVKKEGLFSLPRRWPPRAKLALLLEQLHRLLKKLLQHLLQQLGQQAAAVRKGAGLHF
jgi:hypothetical protein